MIGKHVDGIMFDCLEDKVKEYAGYSRTDIRMHSKPVASGSWAEWQHKFLLHGAVNIIQRFHDLTLFKVNRKH